MKIKIIAILLLLGFSISLSSSLAVKIAGHDEIRKQINELIKNTHRFKKSINWEEKV